IGLLIFKPFNWREWIAGLLGFATLYLILFIIYFWLDKSVDFIEIWSPLSNPTFTKGLKFETHDYLALVIPAIILILFIISLRQSFYKSIVHIRKSFQLLFFIFILSLTSFYLNPTYQEYHFLLCIPPLSIYMAYYFNSAKIRWLYESLFLLMIMVF